MAQRKPDVKSDSGRRRVPGATLWTGCLKWMKERPLLGWYIAVMGTFNVVLQFVQILGH